MVDNIVEFDTRNFTIHNNFEYTDVIPMPNEQYVITEQVHGDRNYIIEVFIISDDINRYLLIDNVGLQDVTLRENAALGTGHGTRTKGIPFREFVYEDKLYLEKEDLRHVLKFYNALAGLDVTYPTVINSRDAALTSTVLEVSGGSRLNYRVNPDWVTNTKATNYNNYTLLEFDD